MTFSAPAKVTRPQPARVLARTHLYERLDRSRTTPVVWIVAPPGAGKTTLVSSYLDSHDVKGIWYQVDAGDEDPATFFHYMGIAARHAAPRSRKPLPVFTSEHFPSLAVFTRRYFEALFSRLKAPVVVVLDNYQEVAKDSAFHAIVAEAAAVLPEGVTMLIISRSEPPPNFARLRANGMLDMLDSAELKLTLDESSALAVLRDKRKLDLSELERLHKRTDGWTAGLILLLDRPDQGAETLPVPVDASYQVLFDYFATEIFHKLPTTTQSILCQAALFPKASVAWVRELTGQAEAGTILADLYRRNYFVVKHGRDEVYQFHPLFHDFLLHRAQEVFPASQIIALRNRAAALLAGAGDIEAVVELWVAAANWQALEAHVLNHASALVTQARFHTLENWLRSLPTNVLEHGPWLCYWLGVCRMQFASPETEGYFEQAFHLFRARSDRTGALLAWTGIVNAKLGAGQNVVTLDHWIEEFPRIAGSEPLPPQINDQIVISMFGALIYRQPQHPDIGIWCDRAQSILQSGGDLYLRVWSGISLNLYFVYMGNVGRSQQTIKWLSALARAPALQLLARLLVRSNEVLHTWLVEADAPRCFKIVEDALAYGEQTGVRVWNHHLACDGAAAALTAGDTVTARKMLRRASDNLGQARQFDIAYYHFLCNWEALLRDDLAEAEAQMNACTTISKSIGFTFGNAVVAVMAARTLIEQGLYDIARVWLDEAHEVGASTHSLLIQYMVALDEAHLALRQGDETLMRQWLVRAFAIGREGNLMMFHGWRAKTMALLCAYALEAGIEVEYVCILIRRRELAPPPSHGLLEFWPFPLKIYTLGRFSVHIDDKPLLFTGKTQKKPLELLKGLIALGGRQVREDKLADALWPQAEDAPQALATTLHRLRKLIGEKAIERSEGCLTLSPLYCWVDIWAFERHLTRLDQICQEQHVAEIVPQVERIFTRYGSGFLPGDSDTRWTLTTRERLRSKLLRQIESVADVLNIAHQHEAAIGCYRKALEIDPLIEALYYGLMQCYAATGRHAEALSTYERCRRMLNDQLGVKPSPRTEALAGPYKTN